MDPWIVLTLGSGIVLALLGLFLITADPRRDWNRVFALFAIFWGLQIVAANGVRVLQDPQPAHVAATMSIALLIPLYFFLVVFASIFPRPRPPFATSWWAMGALLVPAALGLGVLLGAPELLLKGVARNESGLTVEWGPLFAPLILAPHLGGFLFAIFVMLRRLGEAEQLIERRQVALVLLALAAYTAYNAPLQLINFGFSDAPEARGLSSILIALVMLVGVLLLAVVAVRLLQERAGARSVAASREMGMLLAGIGLAALIGAAEGAVDALGWGRYQLVGLVRAAAVALVVYGVARYQLFDLDLRVRNAAHLLSTAVVALVGGVLAWSLFRSTGIGVTTRLALVIVLVAFLVTLVATAFPRLAERLLPHLHARDDHLYLRRLEVYRAALEASPDQSEDAGLLRLAQRLGLDDDDRKVARRLVRQRLSEPLELAPGRLVFDRYLIDAMIGAGTHGRLFLARDTRMAKKVVLKELEARWRGDPQIFARFLREAKVVGRLRHPRIVSLLGEERQGDDRYLVFEYVEGGTLAERLERGRLPLLQALQVARDLADALQVAHQRGVVHRDLKPANVLLDLDGRAQLADFGVAGLASGAQTETLTGLPDPEDNGGVGNLQYMAPEQARGEPADVQADLYGLGAILYHAVVGHPHRVLHGGPAAMAAQVADEQAPPMDPVPSGLRPLLQRLLAPAPAARPREAAEVAAILRGIGDMALPDAPPHSAEPGRPRPDAGT